jgi:hypothetical protein
MFAHLGWLLAYNNANVTRAGRMAGIFSILAVAATIRPVFQLVLQGDKLRFGQGYGAKCN